MMKDIAEPVISPKKGDIPSSMANNINEDISIADIITSQIPILVCVFIIQ